MELNLLKIGFTLMTLFIVVIGGFINNFEKCLPTFIAQTFRYGKFAYKGEPSSLRFIILEVPKRWFKHFYIFSSIWSTYALMLMTYVYIFGGDMPHYVNVCLDFLGTSHRRAGVSAISAFIALILLTLQSWRRFYETFFVSVFSDSNINIAHYMVGYIHYFGAVAAVLVEAPGLTPLSIEHKAVVSLSDIRWTDALGSALFLWAFVHQFRAAVILANLRKNKKGDVVSMRHNIPSGDWFELVSCPHLLSEALMYLGLGLVLLGNYTWPFVFFWVLSNQMETALLTHWWYLSHFKEYPKERHAFIPYVL
ncbi:polyprenol reductase-like [Homalodisca vitripennis]|uniref:polyprenol reductase-like n=1 Tax=Homalodisca vitripennis TaxID=197043 RepID=UPI001EEA6F0B|nr:polyprenol reductase-like [Homalodisca vitripennis]